MPMIETQLPPFWPPSGISPRAETGGFRFGSKGTHSSRTLMFGDLDATLTAVPRPADRAAYIDAIVEGNCLQKPTTATRRLSAQRLSELYALDPRVPLFRVLRSLWFIDSDARQQLALLAALARDPLLMASAPPVIALPVGAELPRASVYEALRAAVDDRMNDATLDKVVRNVASSWVQSGHLVGRTFKHRQWIKARATTMAFALWLAEAAGFRGELLLRNGWIQVLDCTASAARGLAVEAKRLDLIDLHTAGDVTDFGLKRLDPAMGRR